VALVVIVVLALFAGRQQIDDEIRTQTQRLLQEMYPELEIRVDWARRLSDTGIELRGVAFVDPRLSGRNRHLLSIERMELDCDSSLSSLISRDVVIDHIRIEGPRFRGERAGSGRWSLSCLVPRIDPDRPLQMPSIELVDGEIELTEALHPGVKLALWRNVNLHLSPATSIDNSQVNLADSAALGKQVQQRTAWTFGGKLSSGRFGQTHVTGWFVSPRQWHVDGGVTDLIVDEKTWSLAPHSTWDQLEKLPKLGANVSFRFRVDQLPQQPILFAIEGDVRQGWMDDPRYPYPLTAVDSQFEFTSDQFSVNNFFARSGAAEIRGSAVFRDFELRKPYQIALDLKQFPVDRRLRLLLTKKLRTSWDELNPSGRCDGSVTFVFDGQRLTPSIHITCDDSQLEYHRLPYRLRDVSGKISYEAEHLSVDLSAPLHGTTVTINAELDRPGPQGIGEITIRTVGHVPLDKEFIAALPEKSQRFIADLTPRGWFKVNATFSRNRLNAPKSKHITIEVREGSIQYAKFPYAVHRIRGVVEMLNDTWTLTNLRGGNASGYITASGNWHLHEGNRQDSNLTFECHDIPLNDELRDALPQGMKRLWNDLQPNGTVDYLKIKLGYHPTTGKLSLDVFGQKWEGRQHEVGRAVSVVPSWFPYRFDDVTGMFRYVDGRVELHQIRGRHDRTEVQRVNGVGAIAKSGEWEVRLRDLAVTNLHLDHDLIEAFPEALSRGLSRVGVQGPLGLQGRVTFRGGREKVPEVNWNLDFDMEDVRIECGASLEHVRGQISLYGTANSHGFVSDGRLKIDSLFFKDHQIVNVTGPIRIEPKQIFVGSFATQRQGREVPQSVQGNVLGGVMTMDAKVDTLSGKMQLELALESGDLRQIAREFASQRTDIHGRASVTATLVGQANDPQTWRGGGIVRLWDADLYESPFMARLLSVLKYARFDKSSFSRSSMDYRVEGDRIVFDRVTLDGPIRLRGRGELTRQRQLDMNFYVELVDEIRQIPFLRTLAMGANKNALAIRVTGTLDEPIIVKQPFPELNRGLQEIFVDAPGRDGNARRSRAGR
jgi:hypothetical protein